MVYGRYNKLVFMGFKNQHSHNYMAIWLELYSHDNFDIPNFSMAIS
jgi:hypothetical protein